MMLPDGLAKAVQTARPYERRFTEEDIRRDPTLMQIACNYARSYVGEFTPMVNAYNLLATAGTLPIAIAKTVLNCMRHDARVAGLLPMPGDEPARPGVVDQLIAADRLEIKRCSRITPHAAHRYGVRASSQNMLCHGVKHVPDLRIKAKVKAVFAVARTGSVIHTIDQDEVVIEHVYDYALEARVPKRLVVPSVCGIRMYNPRLVSILDAVALTQAIDEPVPYCQRCGKLALKRNGEEE